MPLPTVGLQIYPYKAVEFVPLRVYTDSFFPYITRSWMQYKCYKGFPGGSQVKASAWNVGDPGSIPGSERSPGEGNGTPLQNSCMENPMEGGAW